MMPTTTTTLQLPQSALLRVVPEHRDVHSLGKWLMTMKTKLTMSTKKHRDLERLFDQHLPVPKHNAMTQVCKFDQVAQATVVPCAN
jgi:hypothetical protein